MGSSIDEFLNEERTFEAAQARAMKEVGASKLSDANHRGACRLLFGLMALVGHAIYV